MEKKTPLENSVEKVLEELRKAGYCQSSILIINRAYNRLLKSAAIMQTDTFNEPIREFGKYLQSSGYSDSYVIPKKVCQKQSRTIPHFFTNDEIVKFFNVCDMLPPRKGNIVRHLFLPMLYRLLYCCGVRTCEARLLMRKNANLHIGYIDIFHSKGLKDRRVFLPEDLRSLYMKYDVTINDIFPDRTYFFPSKSNTCYQCGAIGRNFNKILKAAGLGEKLGSKARAYDFRYPFCFFEP
ncbi:MAG: tyrosine-type recombinase/integrase [Desulfosporosinus sp.]|nr:tyrosine-type recombinase/integrase [Desulfosporosinus sp.]